MTSWLTDPTKRKYEIAADRRAAARSQPSGTYMRDWTGTTLHYSSNWSSADLAAERARNQATLARVEALGEPFRLEGWDAYYAGKPCEDNPYGDRDCLPGCMLGAVPDRFSPRTKWRNGWNSAYWHEDREQRSAFWKCFWRRCAIVTGSALLLISIFFFMKGSSL